MSEPSRIHERSYERDPGWMPPESRFTVADLCLQRFHDVVEGGRKINGNEVLVAVVALAVELQAPHRGTIRDDTAEHIRKGAIGQCRVHLRLGFVLHVIHLSAKTDPKPKGRGIPCAKIERIR